MRAALIVAACSFCAAAVSGQNLVRNGSFEQPVGNQFIAGHSAFYGWQSDDVSIADATEWQPAAGNQSIRVGQISQQVPVQVGQWYGLSFQIAGDPFNGPSVKSFSYEIGQNTPAVFTATFDAAGHTYQSLGWHRQFRAVPVLEPLTYLSFSSATPGAFLDDVRLYPILPGDTNGDGIVNFTDLVTLAGNYRKSGDWTQGDFSGKGVVGFDDLVMLARNYGQSVDASDPPPVTVVPEPLSAWLIAPALGVLWHRRAPRRFHRWTRP